MKRPLPDLDLSPIVHYTLDDQHHIHEEPDLLAWGRWMESSRKQCVVKQENVGTYRVSTIFLGFNHDILHRSPPILFETMVFRQATPDEIRSMEEGGVWPKSYIEAVRAGERLVSTGEQRRCRTWDEALRMHADVVKTLETPKQ
jgi:hypothetical protein